MTKKEVMNALDVIEMEYQNDIRETEKRVNKIRNELYAIPDLDAKYKANSFTEEEAAIVDEYEDLIDWQMQCLARKEEKEIALKAKVEAEANELLGLFNADYLPVRQGIATNKLSKVRGRKKDFEFDELLKSGKTIQNIGGDVITVLLANYADNKRLRASTYKLLMALLMEFTETNAKDTTVTLPLKKYMELRGLTNEVAARRQVNEDLEILYSLSLSITYGAKPKNARERKSRRNYMDMRLVIKKGIKNSVISATFAPDFYEALKSYQLMPVAKKILALDDKNLPHAFYFLKFLLEYMNMNYFKANRQVISVASLLASSPEMPTYEEIHAQNRHYDERIIKPFEDNLNALQDMNILTWHYVQEPEKNDWDSFIKAKIYFELMNYPKRKRKEITKKTDNNA